MDAIDWTLLVLKVLVVFVALILSTPIMVLLERKWIGRIQERPGPNRVGLYALYRDLTGAGREGPVPRLPQRWFRNGELQTLIDGIKLLLKEDFIPPKADRLIFLLAPAVGLLPAALTFTIIPFGPEIEVTLGGQTRTIALGLTDLPVGLLFYMAMTSIGVYGIVLAGWASNSKYALLGGLRSSAQLVSYELTLGLSLVGVLLIVGSFNMREILASQADGLWAWHLWRQPVGFLLFLVAGFAETNRLPFDLPEGESELGAGFHTEYSSLRWAMFMMAEYMNVLTFSAILATVFLGGYHGPIGLPGLPWPIAALSGLFWFSLKLGLIFFFFVLVRGTLPRLRYDQLMNLGWKWMFPVAMANLMLTAAVLAADVPGRGLLLFVSGLALIVVVDALANAMKRRALGHVA